MGDLGHPPAQPEDFADAVGAAKGPLPTGPCLAWGLVARDAFSPG